MKKGKMKLLAVVGIILLAAIYYYVALPAINIHSSDFWIVFDCAYYYSCPHLHQKKEVEPV